MVSRESLYSIGHHLTYGTPVLGFDDFVNTSWSLAQYLITMTVRLDLFLFMQTRWKLSARVLSGCEYCSIARIHPFEKGSFLIRLKT